MIQSKCSVGVLGTVLATAVGQLRESLPVAVSVLSVVSNFQW